MQSVQRLARVNLELALACIKFLVTRVKEADAKYAKTIDETAHTEENLRLHIFSLKQCLKAERDCIAQLKKDRVDEFAENRDFLADRLKTYNAMG